ncbi:MAG: peptidylprolyl isomerase [Planctomycetota bacterium]
MTQHEPGVLSMARTSDPNSAGSQFFICLEKVPHLDRQYSAFREDGGRVESGCCPSDWSRRGRFRDQPRGQ